MLAAIASLFTLRAMRAILPLRHYLRYAFFVFIILLLLICRYSATQRGAKARYCYVSIWRRDTARLAYAFHAPRRLRL